MIRTDNQKLYATAKEAIERLSDDDLALLLADMLSGGFDMSDTVADICFENGGDKLAAALGAYVGNQDGTPLTDVCGYVIGSRNSVIASRAFDASRDGEAV